MLSLPPSLARSIRLVQPARTPLLITVRTHLGYIPFEGRVGRRLSNSEKFYIEAKRANLQPVKKVTYSFDPVREDHHSIRNFMYWWNNPKVLATNNKLLIKTEVVDDRREPKILFDLVDGRQLEIRTALLSALEIATVTNQYLLPLVKEEVVAVETKSAKAAAGSGGGASKKGKGKK